MTRVVVDDSSVVDDLGNNDHTYFEGTYKAGIFTDEIQGTCYTKVRWFNFCFLDTCSGPFYCFTTVHGDQLR